MDVGRGWAGVLRPSGGDYETVGDWESILAVGG